MAQAGSYRGRLDGLEDVEYVGRLGLARVVHREWAKRLQSAQRIRGPIRGPHRRLALTNRSGGCRRHRRCHGRSREAEHLDRGTGCRVDLMRVVHKAEPDSHCIFRKSKISRFHIFCALFSLKFWTACARVELGALYLQGVRLLACMGERPLLWPYQGSPPDCLGSCLYFNAVTLHLRPLPFRRHSSFHHGQEQEPHRPQPVSQEPQKRFVCAIAESQYPKLACRPSPSPGPGGAAD